MRSTCLTCVPLSNKCLLAPCMRGNESKRPLVSKESKGEIADYMVQMYRCKVQPGRQKFTNTASIPGGLACNWDRQCELDRLDRVQLIMPRLLPLSASAEQEKAARDNLTEKFNPRAGKLMWNCRGPHQWIMSVQHDIS